MVNYEDCRSSRLCALLVINACSDVVLSRHENAGYTTVDWLANCQTKLFVGCENGELAIVDVRYTKESRPNTQKTKVANGYINKIPSYSRNNE